MREISLTQGYVAIVDDMDFEWLSQHKWHIFKNKAGNVYAKRNIPAGKYKQRGVLMHRVIIGVQDRNMEIDHIDHNGLNNQRHNLRVAPDRKNSCNKSPKKNGTSKYLGVSWNKEKKAWMSCIRKNGTTYHLGRFITEEAAADAYDKKAKELHGEFANLNFKRLHSRPTINNKGQQL